MPCVQCLFAVSDLSILGWDVKPEPLSAVTQLMQRHRDKLNLATHPDVVNGTVHQMISYLENNPLKNCVLVIDAEKVKFAQRDVQHEVNYLRLLQSAERNVGKISKCACSLGNFVLSQCQCHSLYLGK